MKKWLLLIGLVIVLVACNNNNSMNEQNNVNNNNEVENEENNENNEDDKDVVENNVENNDEETNSTVNNNSTENEKTSNNDDEEKSTEQILKEKVYKIFAAQREYDYYYLTSVLSDGSELDKDNNLFTFNNVTYPHDQEFLDEVAEDDLEFRYTHEEDDGVVIVGFAAIDYENESSFVIDFQFVLDGNEWKMNDMDINM